MCCHSGGLRYGEPHAVANAIGYAKFFIRSHAAVIRVYDEAGNVTEAHEHAGDFKEKFHASARWAPKAFGAATRPKSRRPSK
jgi:hypothetical protein